MPNMRETLDTIFSSLEHIVRALDKEPRPPGDARIVPDRTVVKDPETIARMILQGIDQAYARDDAPTQANTATFYLTEKLDDSVKEGDRFSYGNTVNATVESITPQQDAPDMACYVVKIILGKNAFGPLPGIN